VCDPDLGTYFRPAGHGNVLVGGLEPACDPLDWVDDPEAFTTITPTREVWDAHTLRLARRMPDLQVPSRPTGIAALYDVSDDWIPIYDRSDRAGFYLACGTSGNQFKNAPLIGRYLGAIIDACQSGHDHDADPVRLHLERTGLDVNLGHYSRLRDAHASSGSVLG
jgi:sarcosine oxidase, subunit beta